MTFRYSLIGITGVAFFLTLFSLSVAAQTNQWKPIDPAMLAVKAPQVEKDADAEALLWEVYVYDAGFHTEYNHYLRIKIFTERGKESQKQIDLPYSRRVKIDDIAGRTIKPDGTIVELKKDEIFDREVVRFGKVKVKSFAMPAVEPGAIIEYRWKQTCLDRLAHNVALQFQRNIPVQTVRYFIKPLRNIAHPMNSVPFRVPTDAKFSKESNGYHKIELANLPAYHEEPDAPPEANLRSWMLIYYGPNINQTQQMYWHDNGKTIFEEIKGDIKPNNAVKAAALTAVGDAVTTEQKIERLARFCSERIKNIDEDIFGLTEEQRRAANETHSPAHTLKQGYGGSADINFLFGAMAVAVGLEVRMAMISDRSKFYFTPELLNIHFIRTLGIAVKVGENWRFVDSASRHLPVGMMPWIHEGVYALILDPKEPFFVVTAHSAPEKSREHAKARLRLYEDGTITGEVWIEYSGHRAGQIIENLNEHTPAERERILTEGIKSRLPGAEVSEMKIDLSRDPNKPASYSYKIKVAGYAKRNDKQIFLQPSFFQKGIPPRFTANSRQYDLYFDYGYLEEADVMIDLPPGYTLENAESPASFPLANVGNYQVEIAHDKDTNSLIYRRKFKFGALFIPKQYYADLKKLLDLVHQMDNHRLTLR